MKRLTFIGLILTGLTLVASGAWAYYRYAAWLRSYGLDGLALIGLLLLGVFALAMPLSLRDRWARLSVRGMLHDFVTRGGLMLGVLAGLALLFFLIGQVIALPARFGYGALILPWLTLLVPLAMVSIDLYKQSYDRTLTNFGLGLAMYTFRIYGMLLIQFIFIPVAFVLFPAGFFVQFLGAVDFIARQLGYFIAEMPLLCSWFSLGPDYCARVAVSLHLGHLLLAALALKFGHSLFDKSAELYHTIGQGLADRLQKTA